MHEFTAYDKINCYNWKIVLDTLSHLLGHKAGQEGRGEILLENSFMR